MPTDTTDVKQSEASSATQKDEKQTFDQAASQLIEQSMAASSTDEKSEEADSSAVLEKNETGEDKVVEESNNSVDETKSEDKQTEETKEEEKSEKEKTEEVDETEAAVEDKKTSEAIPYSRFKEVNDKVREYEPLAKAHTGVVQYCQQNNISPEQYREALAVQALVNTNPQEALKRLEPLVEQLKVALGTGLPSDLQKEVTEGTLSEARAKELAKARLHTASLERQNTFSAQQREAKYAQDLQQSLASWMQSKTKLNPDFKPKVKETEVDGMFETFQARYTQAWLNNPPNTIQEATVLAEKAYDATNAFIRRLQLKPKAKKTFTSNGSAGRSSVNKEPKSSDDVMKAVGRKYGYVV